jgi:tetrahydromethanopterin S-methyltransferase subunit A
LEPYYGAFNADSPVAICTLSSPALQQQLCESPLAARVAIIGPLETENIGLEKMLVTLLEQPRIRWLIVCGEEARGRYQGQALFSLFAQGADADGRILGARGRRARIPTLNQAQLDAVRRQVRLKDLMGSLDFDTIAAAVDACIADDPGVFTERVELPLPPPIEVPEQPFRVKTQDPNGYFVILVDRGEDRLLVEHYTPDGTRAHRIAGPDAESLCVALVDWGLVTRLEHAAYLGRELMRAEIALRSRWPYRQDEPFSRTSDT